MNTENDMFDLIKEQWNENKLYKVPFYMAGALGAIWVLGKSATILAGAIRGFRDLANAMKGN